ncbi:serine-rich adhesin for platelets isoform X1 [Neodiprion pinetum]|uniref:serine-rich adhesin for platelets isoform X1 n=1 Tax=Neodiprion pinetum TaxID=441929 RepID=UPI001EDEB9DF|nr:uncharacterized protein LOC124222448 isoform X1 [Neodiprion pinetum]
MDIKLNSTWVALVLAVLVLVIATSSAGHRSRGSGRIAYRGHNRREVRDYLAPPSQNAFDTRYGIPSRRPSPLIPYRPGRYLDPPPTPSTEAPGYFSRFMSWINPWGGTTTVAPSGYLPPEVKAKENKCSPCNKIPWNPMANNGQHDAYGSGTTNVEIQPSDGQEGKNNGGSFTLSYSEGIRVPDFSYGRPTSPQTEGLQPPPADLSASPPIPFPYLYPGPMPPLFKAKPFHSSPDFFKPTPSIQLTSGLPEFTPESIPNFSGPEQQHLDDGHVDVLPPGAEVDISGHGTEIRDTPPPGYEGSSFESEGYHEIGYGSTTLNVDQSKTVTAGYNVQPPVTVEVIHSVPAAEFSASVDHPVHYEESPIIDLSKDDQREPQGAVQQNGDSDYTPGLNPPPNEAVYSYNSNSGDSLTTVAAKDESRKNSYGIPVNNNLLADSLAASSSTNGTSFSPTPSYNILGVDELPVSHETAKSNAYESFPPSTEKLLISVQNSEQNFQEPSKQPLNGSTLQQQTPQNHGKIVDSYQQNIKQPSSGQSAVIQNPEPLVSYRPDSLYVPYPPYSGTNTQQVGVKSTGNSQPPVAIGPTTEEPFLDALLKSYDNFKQEMAVKDYQERLRTESQQNQGSWNSPSLRGTTWVSQPQPSFAVPGSINPSVFPGGNTINSQNQRQQSGVKRNKQVQIIIPYTSQYTPSPFQPVPDDWSGRGSLEQTQGRKVPVIDEADHNYVGQESQNVEIKRPLRPLENLLSKEISKKPFVKQENNSIDVTRLQKNIDNWTIQEYSRGMTSSTALPSSSHPYLLPSKKIPNEYLTSTQSSAPQERIDTNQSDLPGLNYNDLEHEGAASGRVDVPHIQVFRVESVSKSTETDKSPITTSTTTESTTSASSLSSFTSTSPTTTTTQQSWAELPVSISPHNNERVYVVTPQPVRTSKSEKYEAIERAYQVLPQAVNNLASASVSAPEDSPLWGIMEHEKYARNDERNPNATVPILYSGHSKVSNAKH